ncbi:MAG: heterodisulfide reductase-related iron-sulfur binding cluster, partial [Desulfobacterales bacterium]|nr:heterodisulfide reductase-related iron-sulfur binding cluster [Desulfobacterales bacterium]
YGIMEKTLAKLGLQALNWGHASQCCGTFLTVARPDIVTPKVNLIMQGAAESGADCVVTACAMCHMNLEVRCTLKNPIPIFHFSEILSLAFGTARHRDWFSRHLIDPRPLLKSKGLVTS